MRALVIDDSTAMRTLLAEIVGERGYVVHAVESAEEGLEAHLADPFELVLVDWTLPGMSGPELCRALRAREDGERVVLLVITARVRPEDVHAVLDAGADDFISKPVDPERLRTRLIVASRTVDARAAGRARDGRASEPAREGEASGERSSLLAKLIELSPDAVMVARAGSVVDANARAARFFGFDARAQLIGRATRELVHPDDLPRLAEDGLGDLRFRRADGAIVDAEASRTTRGGLETLVVLRDVTAQRERLSRSLVVDRLGATAALAGGVALELSAPLAQALASAEQARGELVALATTSDASERLRAIAGRLDEAASDLLHAEEVVRALRAFASDAYEPCLEDAVPMLRSLLLLAQGTLRSRARVELELSEVPPLAISRARLAQIFWSLLVNASQILEELAPGKLRVRSETQRSGLACFSFEVVGTDRPSARLDASLLFAGRPSDAHGLSVARTLALHAGGDLSVEGAPREGALFQVRLPPAVARR
ncbi:MAG: response regulator [Myxococcales bacterium]|nr:response regulator [Myxococcales bacterium]